MCAFSRKKYKTDSSKKQNKQSNDSDSRGSLKVIGIGPGDIGNLSNKAKEAIEESEIIVGYKTYIKLIENLILDKKIISYGMTQEVKRAQDAIKLSKQGKKVCVISSGDSGIYGMAGLVLELLDEFDFKKIEFAVIPGISASIACASILGAPLMHDFVTISLSDLLTDFKLIEKRLVYACKGDFVIVLYNPKSKTRIKPFEKACKIFLKNKSPDTPVGIVKNASRDNEEIFITTLKEISKLNIIDMRTTIIIGNSKTYIKGKYIITPRGYNLF